MRGEVPWYCNERVDFYGGFYVYIAGAIPAEGQRIIKMSKMIYTEEDLIILFEDHIKREVFIRGMKRLFDVINERTINVPFLNLECVKYE